MILSLRFCTSYFVDVDTFYLFLNWFSTRVSDGQKYLCGSRLYAWINKRKFKGYTCTATEMIPTIEMISATEMTPNHHRNDPHHRNDTYSQSKWSRHKFSEPWLKWTWDFAMYSKFFVYSCKHDSKQRKIEKAIRLITVLYTDFIFKILTFF